MSAGQASPAAKGSGRGVPADPVRALQHALYRAAKADPGRRFHALYDKVCRSDVLWRAWVAVRRNNGAPGIDKITLAQVEEYGVYPAARRAGQRAEGGPLPSAACPAGAYTQAGVPASRGRCRFLRFGTGSCRPR